MCSKPVLQNIRLTTGKTKQNSAGCHGNNIMFPKFTLKLQTSSQAYILHAQTKSFLAHFLNNIKNLKNQNNFWASWRPAMQDMLGTENGSLHPSDRLQEERTLSSGGEEGFCPDQDSNPHTHDLDCNAFIAQPRPVPE